MELRRAGFQVFAIDRFRTDRLGLRTYAYLEVGPRRFDGARAVPSDDGAGAV